MKKSTITAARLITERLQADGFRYRAVFQVLTYAEADGWNSKDITRYIYAVKSWMFRRGIQARYVWTAELQQRGAVHYNVIWWLPRGVTLPKPDKQGWWPHGSTRSVWARNAVGYIAKYASKMEQKEGSFPEGLRLHGCGGLVLADRHVLRWWKMPRWLRDVVTPPQGVRRRAGGGWLDAATGEVFESPYEVRFVRGFVILRIKQGAGEGGPARGDVPPVACSLADCSSTPGYCVKVQETGHAGRSDVLAIHGG